MTLREEAGRYRYEWVGPWRLMPAGWWVRWHLIEGRMEAMTAPLPSSAPIDRECAA